MTMKRMTKHYASKGPSQRQLRVGEHIRHLLFNILHRGHLGHDTLDNVSLTITEVRMSVDLKHAFIFALPLGGENQDSVIKALRQIAPMLRNQIAKDLRMRNIPTLHFESDISFEAAHRIHKVLNSEHVARDLKPTTAKELPPEPSDDD
jgi:ribosome-binding factor A